jgi:hypothetical protein
MYACNTEIDFVPGGYTSKLQVVMDVGLNWSFKDEYWRQFAEAFMVTSTTGKPHWQDVAKWAWQGWKRINTEMILKTWQWVLSWGDKEAPMEVDSDNEDNDDDNEVFMDTWAVVVAFFAW